MSLEEGVTGWVPSGTSFHHKNPYDLSLSATSINKKYTALEADQKPSKEARPLIATMIAPPTARVIKIAPDTHDQYDVMAQIGDLKSLPGLEIATAIYTSIRGD